MEAGKSRRRCVDDGHATVDVDPATVGRGVLAFVMLGANEWMGEEATRDALAAIPEAQEAHILAGAASVLVKIRTATTEDLQAVLRRLFAIDGVTSTQTIVVLESFFECPVDVHDQRPAGQERSPAP